MKIFTDLDTVSIKRPVATIGIFDGVHLAHQALINKLLETAKELSGESALITLWPHPRIVLNNADNSIFLINTLEEKIEQLEKTKLENLVILPFDKSFAGTAFSEFVEQTLINRFGILHLVVGYDHRFGRDREGNYERLQKLSKKSGFGLSQQEPVVIDGEKVSSSAVRKYISKGNVTRANEFLGYNYQLSGRVVSGSQKGRELGFPTANITTGDPHKLMPGDGVYAVFVQLESKVYRGMMNIGCRPTFNEECGKSIPEVHLMDYQGNLYDQEIRIEFVQRIRDEKKFSSLTELKAQIEKDRESINSVLRSIKYTKGE
jgi:riboflavin kinase / FMN adenylyltransferase